MSGPAVTGNGFAHYDIWRHSKAVHDLYERRARNEVEEMTCAAQAAEILADMARPGESVLDAGCGAGHFFHSLKARELALLYLGFDANAEFIAMGRSALAPHGVTADRLMTMRLEDFDGAVDHVVCMNVLTYLDNFHRPLERLLRAARRSVILRESMRDGAAQYRYVRDDFLDPGIDLKVHVNIYDRREIIAFIEGEGFSVRSVTDRRTGGDAELSIGHQHFWHFLVATRR